MAINPIDAQIMMLNQTIVGKEQQAAKELPVQLMNADVEKFAKETKDDQSRVVKSPDSEQQQKIDDKNKERQGYQNQKRKKQKEDDAEEERKKIEQQTDPVRGHILDITL